MTKNLLLYHDLILAIVTALEARDVYTASHSSRVAEMAEALCDYIGIEADRKILYHIAAHLHDVGKIGIDDSVLRKPGRLDDAEWCAVKEHTVIGYTILSKIDDFQETADIVRSHHERWGGKGYPDGLCGKNIPQGARIIAVADSIDAMLSTRAYRKGMNPEICKTEIAKNSGMMYDPSVAAATLSHWDELLSRRDSACSLLDGAKHLAAKDR